MIKSIAEIVDLLNANIPKFVDAFKEADISTKDYGVLLENFIGTMNVISSNTALLQEAIAVAKAKQEGENKDESNN